MVHEYRAFALAPRSPVVRLAKAAMAELGVKSRLLASGGGSDANVFNARGLPTVNFDCGMTHVHTSDEHISSGRPRAAGPAGGGVGAQGPGVRPCPLVT